MLGALHSSHTVIVALVWVYFQHLFGLNLCCYYFLFHQQILAVLAVLAGMVEVAGMVQVAGMAEVAEMDEIVEMAGVTVVVWWKVQPVPETATLLW